VSDARITRQGIEVLLQPGAVVSVPRVEAEALVDPDDGTGAVRLTRQGVEVLYTPPPTVLLPRVEAEVLADPDDGTGAARLVRQGVEVLYSPPPFVGIFRAEAEALVDPDDGTGAVRLVRQGIEILYPRPPAAPSPLALPDNYEVFIHSWESGLSLANAYMTDVTSSPITGAEERRSLRDKPRRTMQARYVNTTRAIIDRLIVNARKLTSTRVPFPLYCDESIGAADSASGQTSVWCDTTLRRFFVGGRVLIVPHVDGNFVAMDELDTGIIEEIHDDHLVLEGNLSLSFFAGHFSVYPLIDCEIVLRPQVSFETHHTVQWELTVNEILGANTLPATRFGRPLNMATLEGLPILDFNKDQNFDQGVAVEYVRDGDEYGRGRGKVVDPNDYRYKQVTRWNLLAHTREAVWTVVQFLDWARGRGRSFFAMDEEDLWTPISLDPTFIEIDPLGEFSDFETDLDFIGIEMNDGTIHARRVNTIQDLTTVWRVTTTGDDWPSLDLTDIRRISRVRKSRLVDDEFTEDWRTTEICLFRFQITEVLDEGEQVT
jgi:hypothetical protein